VTQKLALLLGQAIREFLDIPTCTIYHNPNDRMPPVDFKFEKGHLVQYVPHKAVPRGQAWVQNTGPSGRIIEFGDE